MVIALSSEVSGAPRIAARPRLERDERAVSARTVNGSDGGPGADLCRPFDLAARVDGRHPQPGFEGFEVDGFRGRTSALSHLRQECASELDEPRVMRRVDPASDGCFREQLWLPEARPVEKGEQPTARIPARHHVPQP